MNTELSAHLDDVSRACIHCGLCLQECPTYLELGNELDSPRGRIYLLRSLARGTIEATDEVVEHLDLCLDCRACETACPSNVRYGELIESARTGMRDDGRGRRWDERIVDWLIYSVLPYPKRLRRAVAMGRLARRLGLPTLVRRIGVMRRISPSLMKAMELLPVERGESHESGNLPERSDPKGVARSRISLFAGCAATVLTPSTNANALRVLLHNGCAVRCPGDQGCCGAIHHHGGRNAEARDFARANIAAFEGEGAVVNTAAGCGAMLKHYGDLLADDPQWAIRARAFSTRVRDVSEFLMELGPVAVNRDARSGVSASVTYHDACHLAHAQGIRRQPRELLSRVGGLTLAPCGEADMCCGAAGSYNLTQPELAGQLGRRKLANLEASGAEVAAMGNVGCILHLESVARQCGSRLRIAHTIDLLHEAYGLGRDARGDAVETAAGQTATGVN